MHFWAYVLCAWLSELYQRYLSPRLLKHCEKLPPCFFFLQNCNARRMVSKLESASERGAYLVLAVHEMVGKFAALVRLRDTEIHLKPKESK